ncbi:MAG: hypothetical protein PHI72_03800 [Atribacterota bacterium]|nr:hypothetical protein [Atribacterota bacterium]MDD5636793.1 hypothetical protein [Atribacterota bacterium]
MRKAVVHALPYGVLCLFTLLIIMIFWPVEQGWIQLSNSWIALFFVCAFCAIFLFQEDIYHFLDQNITSNFLGASVPLQKHRAIPEIFKDDHKFQEIISGTVMAWMDKINIEKQEKIMREEEITQTIERYKKEKKDNVKWLFLFADYFLVPHSKDILYEINERHYITEEIFQEMTAEMSIDENESEAILEILKFLRFIRKQEEEFIITETGSAYCTYLERINQK